MNEVESFNSEVDQVNAILNSVQTKTTVGSDEEKLSLSKELWSEGLLFLSNDTQFALKKIISQTR